jgi:hypothetical protein
MQTQTIDLVQMERAALDSVNLIQAEKLLPITPERKDRVDRNVEHLKIVLSKGVVNPLINEAISIGEAY